MILRFIKRALKLALHEAVEEWACEVGLPPALVDEMRARRLALSQQEEVRADDRAAAALGVEDDDAPASLPMPSVARLTEQSPEPDEDASEALIPWVHEQRQAQVGWVDIARQAAQKGSPLGEEALRSRYRRWLQKNGHDGQA